MDHEMDDMNSISEENDFDEFEEPETIELIDEDGNSQLFELLGSFDLDGKHYLAVSEPSEEEEPESMDVFFLRTVKDENGNDIYISAEDEESKAAFDYFLTLVDAEEA